MPRLPEDPHLRYLLVQALTLLEDLRSEEIAPEMSKGIDQALTDALDICRQKNLLDSEPIRTLHHLSCTGGTLISKCIASMPNVLLLNEINPHSTMLTAKTGHARFTPTDTIALLRQGDPFAADALINKVFQTELEVIRREIWKSGRRLVLRDHSHSDYLIDRAIGDRLSVYALVAERFPIRSVLTVRNPIDSWLSMKRKNWHAKMEPASFDEYCRRYLQFLNDHGNLPIVKYEKFVKQPAEVMQQICQTLDLEYEDEFQLVFDSFEFSGDSGRGGSVIKEHAPRKRSKEMSKEAAASAHYEQLIEKLSYGQ